MLILAIAALPLVALVAPGDAGAVPTPSSCPNASFRNGPSALLPDCRAYEQVSPVAKGGFEGVTVGEPGQAMANGEGLEYSSLGAFSGAHSASFPDAYVARRGPGGWTTTNISPPTPDITPPGGDPTTYDLSANLAQQVVELPLQVLAAGATPEVDNIFLSGTTGAGEYAWLNNVKPKVLLPEGCPLPRFLAACWQVIDQVAFAGASADYRHILFESTESLAGGAPEERENLYESKDEGGTWHVSLVGVLPDEKPSEGSTAGGGSSVNYASVEPKLDKRVINAISEDGSSIVFQAPADGGEPVPAQAGLTEVYDRLEGAETIELSQPAAGATPKIATPEAATFWAASSDGERVFFTSSAELTTPSYTGATEPKGQDLYEYNLGTKTLTDLTVDTNLPADEEEGAAVQGVVGTSNDGSYVYFVAKGQLVPGKGVDHADNLYMVHEGESPVYIATLSQADEFDWTEVTALLEAYVTPDGKHIAFSSVEPLATTNFPSGYDNVNESTSTPEKEVYEYSAQSGSLTCASCDPSGAAPIGPGLLASVKGPARPGISENSPFHQVREVSDNGRRVFFSSTDQLTSAGMGNVQRKLYEYELDGEGSCETADGCVYLISSPESQEEAEFLDADSEGNDVFFATPSQLTFSDQDRLLDVYDARVDGGVESPPTQAPCGSCQQTPEPLTSATPLSASEGASGNLAPPAAQKGETKAQKLAKALKACRKKKGKKRRRSCEARARKRYGGAAQKARKPGHGSKRRGR